PGPAVDPVPEVLPDMFPQIKFAPKPIVQQTVISSRSVQRAHVAQPRLSRRPPRGSKEKKTRMSPFLAFLWNGVSPITEGIEFIDTMYECLPKGIKVNAYRAQGDKQPTPNEKLE